MKIHNIILFVVLCLSGFSPANAQIKLPALFSDNMILQQQMQVPMWGWGDGKQPITITTSWDSEVYKVKADAQGEWKVEITTPQAGGPFFIELMQGNESKKIENVMIGEVWLCSGQSNMEMPLKGFPGQPVKGGNEDIVRSANDQIRLITIPRNSTVAPKDDFDGEWKMAAPHNVADFSATAWYFGSMLHDVLDVPVGLVNVSYGGSNIEAWMNAEMLEDFDSIPIPKKPEDVGEPNRTATALFNGMLSPVIGYGIKGVIWYQGESNYDRPFQYQNLMEEMVRSWRGLWDQPYLAFYYAQIAPFNYAQFTPGKVLEKYNSAYLREAQLKASKEIPNSGMAVLLDLGKKNGIHPPDKEKGGERLAYLALAKTYGLEGFEYQSPEFEAMEIKGSTVIVAFKNVPNGITSYGKAVTLFEIAGKDKVFYPANAVLRRKSVMLSSPEVSKPVAVRYAFKDFVEAEIFSTGGLPLSSFRTDNW